MRMYTDDRNGARRRRAYATDEAMRGDAALTRQHLDGRTGDEQPTVRPPHSSARERSNGTFKTSVVLNGSAGLWQG
jgi:hypothetical protein